MSIDVSFIVPFFNKERYVAAVIAAIRAQSGDFSREIIAIDDGSTDGTRAVLDALAADHDDLRILSLDDLGPAVALNRAAAVARGRFFKFVDGDDLLRTDATAMLLKAMDRGVVMAFGWDASFSPSAVDAVGPRAAVVRSEKITRIDDAVTRIVTKISLLWSGCLVDADAYRAVGGCDERVFVHDASILPRLATQGAFVELDVVLVDRPVEDPDRWSNRSDAQVFHDGTYALVWFLRDFPDLPHAIRRLAYRRCAGRAYKWALRNHGLVFALPALMRHLASRAPWAPRYDRRLWAICGTYQKTATLRLPGGAPTAAERV